MTDILFKIRLKSVYAKTFFYQILFHQAYSNIVFESVFITELQINATVTCLACCIMVFFLSLPVPFFNQSYY